MSLFYLILLILFGALLFSFVQGLFTSRRNNSGRLSATRDALRETQELSREQAAVSSMNPKERENFEDAMTLSVCFARFSLQVAYADGYLAGAEVQSILGFFRGAHPSFSEHVRDVLQQDVNNPETIDWDYNLQEARRVLAKSGWHEFSSVMFDGLLRISLADGVLNTAELEAIFRIMGQLGWTRQRMESWFHTRAGFGAGYENAGSAGQGAGAGFGGRTSGPSENQKLKEAYDVLGVRPDTSLDEVKKRYRELAREHHPDRYAQMGEEMQKTATKRFQVIQEAYDLIGKHKKA